MTGKDALLLLAELLKMYRLEILLGAEPNPIHLQQLKEILPFGSLTSEGGNLSIVKGIIDIIEILVDTKNINKDDIYPAIVSEFQDESPLIKLFANAFDDVEDTNKTIRYIKGRVNAKILPLVSEKQITSLVYKLTKAHDVVQKDVILAQLKEQVEKTDFKTTDKDTAIVEEASGDSLDEFTDAIQKAKEETDSAGVMKLGFVGLNGMTQGGVRRGDLATVAAVSHNYKSGLALTMWVHSLIHNKPKLVNEKKKPIAVWLTMEDSLGYVLRFVYRLLYMEEFGKVPDLDKEESREVAKYVLDTLSKNGWNVHFARVDPTDWSYLRLFQFFNNIENKGYEIITAGVDYVTLIPTVGCNQIGGAGTEIRDLVRRVRNYAHRKHIAMISPLQASPAALQLLRNGVPESDLAKEMANKGYYSGSSQLFQEIDLELWISKFLLNGKTYLSVQRGKHRLETTIPEKQKHIILPFPEQGPITGDIPVGTTEEEIAKIKPKHYYSADSIGIDSDAAIF